jgi:hypothetical protein
VIYGQLYPALREWDGIARHRIDAMLELASVSAEEDQPEGARGGGKEATEVACAERDEGTSEAQAPEEDLAR